MGASRLAACGREVAALTVIAVACSALAACGSGSLDTGAGGGTSVCDNPGRVGGLVVERISLIPRNHLRFAFPTKITISDPKTAQSVVRAACALPPMPSGSISCPIDTGIMYRLTFTTSGHKLPAVKVKASGCGQVSGLGQTRWTTGSPRFWQVLGAAMGLTHPDQLTFSGS